MQNERCEYMANTDAKREAHARYDEKTYKNFLFKLRLEDDADIIKSIQEAQENGMNKREWLRELFDGK